MASEATKIAVRGNMYMDNKVIYVTDFKSEVRCDLSGHWGRLEAALASEATKMAVIGNMQMDTKDIVEVIEHHRPISQPFSLQVYRAIALLLIYFRNDG